MALKITTGSPAEGEDKYFPRPLITNKIWRKVRNGEHVLVAAPRRVGKTSLLKDMVRHPQPDYLVKYLIVQSVDRENEFYKKLYNELVEDSQLLDKSKRYFEKASTAVKGYLHKIKGININGVTLDHNVTLDFREEVEKLIRSIGDDCPKVVMVVDEFPHAVENILSDDIAKGIHFLQSIREIRQDRTLSDKVSFIFTGSIGLNNVVKKIDQSNLVNDLVSVPVPPLTVEEAGEFTHRLLLGKDQYENVGMALSRELIDYLVHKIDWLIPYFFQIVVDELSEMHEEGVTMDCAAVDEAFMRIITSRNKYDNYFDHWKSRLRVALDHGGEYKLALDFLNLLASRSTADRADFHDLAVKHEVAEPKYVLSVLEYDGYLNEYESVFRFNSPILKQWWYINVAS